MRTTIRMDKSLAREAKRAAAEAGITFTALVEQALSELLAKRRPAKPQPFVPLPTARGSSKKLSWAEYQRLIEQAQFEDDLRSLGLKPDDGA